MTNERILYSIKDACHQLGGISRTTLYELIKDGKITPVKIYRRTYISHSDIIQFIEKNSPIKKAA